MDDAEWKRDDTPYLIFACDKCHQYSYVKTTQKTKKCLRCGHSHKVKNLVDKVESVDGMTNALNRVKQLQNEYGKQLLKGAPDLASEGSFKIVSNNRKKPVLLPIKNEDENEQLFESFILLLRELSNIYRTFPKYIIEIMAENKEIPQSKLSNLIRRALKEGHLIYHNGSYVVN